MSSSVGCRARESAARERTLGVIKEERCKGLPSSARFFKENGEIYGGWGNE